MEIECPDWKLAIILKEIRKGTLMERVMKEPGREDLTRFSAQFETEGIEYEFGLQEAINQEYAKLRQEIGKYGEFNNPETYKKYIESLREHVKNHKDCRERYNGIIWARIEADNLKPEEARDKAKVEDRKLLNILEY